MASRRNTGQRAYRIVSRKYPPFDGAGAHRWGSRWVSPGRWVVHAAETYSLALLENLVHWQATTPPPTLCCVELEIPTGVEQERIDVADLRASKRQDYSTSRAIGDAWYDRGETVALWVPSVLSPHESNLLLNQRHGDFGRLVVGEPTPVSIDQRLRSRAR